MSTIDQVRTIVQGALDPDIAMINDDEELLLSGLLDSMTVISITGELEKHFQIEIQAMDITIEHFESISAIANYISGQCDV